MREKKAAKGQILEKQRVYSRIIISRREAVGLVITTGRPDTTESRRPMKYYSPDQEKQKRR